LYSSPRAFPPVNRHDCFKMRRRYHRTHGMLDKCSVDDGA